MTLSIVPSVTALASTARQGITGSYEAIRLSHKQFGSNYAARLRRKCQSFGGTFSLIKPSLRSMGALLFVLAFAKKW